MRKLCVTMEELCRTVMPIGEDSPGHKVILYGAGKDLRGYVFELEFVSQMLLKTNEISGCFLENVIQVVDGNLRKQGEKMMLGQKEFCICAPQVLQELPPKDRERSIILITASRYAWEIETSLKEMWMDVDVSYVVAAEMQCFVSNLLSPKIFHRLMKYWSDDYSYEEIPTLTEKLKKWLDGNCVIIPEIGVKVTHKCTLNCKNCLDRVPFLPKTDVPLEQVLRDLEMLDSHAVYIGRLLFITGEVLLYPYMDKVLEKVVNNPKIHEIMINTNGTTRPSETARCFLQSPKCRIYISDYGDIVNMAKAVDYYEKYNIDFSIRTEMKWKPIGRYPSPRGLSPEKLKREYASCGVGNSCPPILTDGKLFPCGISCLFYALNEYHGNRDYAEMSGISQEEFKKRYYQMMNVDYLECCDMCDVSVYGNSTEYVAAGTQKDLKKQWHRSAYTIIKRVQ